jgi:hypothetical protein
MNTKIFAYCERGSDPGFWAEPVNAITNAAFLIAAILAWTIRAGQPQENRRIMDGLLILLVGIIGVGSFLFHTFATRWAALADVLPIGIFMLAYMGYALRRYFGLPWYGVAIGLALFVTALATAQQVICGSEGRCLNGSASYLPAFAALMLIGAILMGVRHRAGASLLAAGVLFGLSLTFRTIDQSACEHTHVLMAEPLGTHFLWHVLNGTLLFVLLRAAVLFGGDRQRTSIVAREAR